MSRGSEVLPYRAEIDGLRALAVMAVILFHLDQSLLGGGFLGVDVFFVISGFLLTGIIYRQLHSGSFSVTQFWSRRIKRLYPALFVMTGVVLCLGCLLLVRPERQQLPIQAVAAVFSFENILLWKTSGGYWDVDSENIALLHTWSLSLEEQFYLFLPIGLLALYRFRPRLLLPVVGLLSGLSFALCFAGGLVRPVAAFYLLPTRMWELLLGSLAALRLETNHERQGSGRYLIAMQVVALVLIVASFILLRNSERYSGVQAGFVCVGTVILLGVTGGQTVVTQFLGLQPLRYIGQASYSLYLWHWPVIVFSRYLNLAQHWVVMLLVIFALSVASYHLIETPFRFTLRIASIGWLALPVFLAAAASLFLFLPDSPLLPELKPLNDPGSMSRGLRFEATESLRTGLPGVYFADTTRALDICVVGSSHARVLCPPIADFARQTGLAGLSMATSGFGITVDEATKFSPDAVQINTARLRQIQKLHPQVCIVAGMWSDECQSAGFDRRFRARILEIGAAAKTVIVVGQVPMVELPPRAGTSMRRYLVSREFSGSPEPINPSLGVQTANSEVEKIIHELGMENVIFLNPYGCFVDASQHVQLLQAGRFVYSDHHHVNDFGAGIIFDRLLRPALTERLGPLASR